MVDKHDLRYGPQSGVEKPAFTIALMCRMTTHVAHAEGVARLSSRKVGGDSAVAQIHCSIFVVYISPTSAATPPRVGAAREFSRPPSPPLHAPITRTAREARLS